MWYIMLWEGVKSRKVTVYSEERREVARDKLKKY